MQTNNNNEALLFVFTLCRLTILLHPKSKDLTGNKFWLQANVYRLRWKAKILKPNWIGWNGKKAREFQTFIKMQIGQKLNEMNRFN